MRRYYSMALLCALAGCHHAPPPAAALPLAQEAISAHWSGHAPHPLSNVRINATGVFKDSLKLNSAVYFQAPDSWAMDGTFSTGERLRFGMSGDRCWRRERHFTEPCTDAARANYARFGLMLKTRLLQGLDHWDLQQPRTIKVDNVNTPGADLGDALIVFDPVSHLVSQIRHDNGATIEAFSDFRPIGGGLIPTHRNMTDRGAPDVDEQWEEIIPGGADAEHLRVPEPNRPGDLLAESDAERDVATMDITTLADLTKADEALHEFARSKNLSTSDSDGLVLTALPDGRWSVSVTLESASHAEALVYGPVRVEKWNRMPVLGVFFAGNIADGLSHRPEVEREREHRGAVIRPGALWQVLIPGGANLDAPQPIALLRIPLQVPPRLSGAPPEGASTRSD